MKKVLASALVALLAISCSKSEEPGVAKEGRLTFSAEAAATRAYFPGESGKMYWSNYDNIAAYSFDGTTLIASDFCAIDAESAGTDEGTFSPKNILYSSTWVGSQADTKTVKFYAYYPATNAAATYNTTDNGVQLNIPAIQSEEFGKSQICFSKGVDMTVAEINKEKLVRFEFAPASSLLRVRFSLAENSDVSEVYIKQVLISAENNAISGDCRLNFTTGTLTPAAAVTGKSTISVALRTPVKITKNVEENPYIYVVLMPSTKSIGALSFTAVTSNNENIPYPSKSSPADGFQAAKRYTLDREASVQIDPASPDAFYIDGGDAWGSNIVEDGSYDDAGNAW
ncbi:MAG: fimbrillin family protein [Alistipes sp.]|nr:fimbrillin family protein [Alistipes sp.]